MWLRRLFPILLFLGALAFPAQAQERRNLSGWCEDGNYPVVTDGRSSTTKVQRSFSQCTVTVYDVGTTNLATIASDSGGTPKANPFTAASSGRWDFWAIEGQYDVRFSGSGIPSPFTRPGLWISTGSGGGGAPADATYITQTPNATLTNEQALSSLASGIMRVATTTGVVTSLTTSSGISSNISDETGTGALVFNDTPTILTPSITTSITSSSTTFSLLNTTVTTLNFAGAATTINLGASSTVLNFGGGAVAAQFRFLEPSASGTNYTAFVAQAQAANITYTLPPDDGTAAGQFLTTDGSGSLTWTTGGGGGGTTINPTDGLLPYRSDATTFLDSHFSLRNASTTDMFNVTTGATAMAFRIYKTRDDGAATPTNFERLIFGSDTTNNLFRIYTDAGGTGTQRPINIGVASGASSIPVGIGATSSALSANVVLQLGWTGSSPTDDIGIAMEGISGQSANFISATDPDLAGVVFGVDANGEVQIGMASNRVGRLTLFNATNANTLTFQSGVSGANITYTFPTDDGDAGEILSTDGAGVLDWIPAGGGGGMAIGGTVTSGTTGSVLFVGSGPVLAQDNTNLFYDDTNNRIGMGTTSPARTIHLTHSGATIRIHNTNAAGEAVMEFERSNFGDVNFIVGYSNESASLGSTAFMNTPNGQGIRFLISSTEKLRLDSTGLGVNGAVSGTEFSVAASATGENAEVLTSAGGATVALTAWTLTADDTSTIAPLSTINIRSSGTAATGFGGSTTYTLESSTTNDQTAAIFTVLWSDATHATRTSDIVFSTVNSATTQESFRITGNGLPVWPNTVTAGGTTGNQTINKPSGTVNFATGTATLTVTNNTVTANSIVMAVVRTNDTTAQIKNVVPGAGTFTINLVSNTTAETSVGFFSINK